MGQVYKANDARLDRTVAIKVLPAHLSGDKDFRHRFHREARAVSSLNHPHICTLHDVHLRQGSGGQVDEEDDVDYMVMEYIEGETLANRLKKGALPLDQALRHAVEIGDALDKAHQHGVVHRDLKPGNIMLTKRERSCSISAWPSSARTFPQKRQRCCPRFHRGETAHPRRLHPRHLPVHGARTARRKGGGYTHGYLRLRVRPLRNDHRAKGVRSREPVRA